jgi:hypothetical protein
VTFSVAVLLALRSPFTDGILTARLNWKYGEDVIIAGSVSDEEAKKKYLKGGKLRNRTSASCRSLSAKERKWLNAAAAATP